MLLMMNVIKNLNKEKMKNLLILITVIIGFQTLKAQEVIMTGSKITQKMQKGNYYKYADEDVEKFSGTWSSEDGKFQIFITDEKKFLDDFDTYMQRLTGKYCYEISDCNFENEIISLKSGSINNKDGIKVTFLFNDQKKNKLGAADLKLIGENKAKWTLKNREGIRVGGYERTFSVPTKAILLKVD